MKTVIIGASGFVGTRLIELLKQQENSVFPIAVSLLLQNKIWNL
jgi:nucleoside-diphosphate-sugar epimerase